MNPVLRLYLYVGILVLALTAQGRAQVQPPPAAPSAAPQEQPPTETAQPGEKPADQSAPVDGETLSMVMSLRNPFVSQLPRAPVVEQPPAPPEPPSTIGGQEILRPETPEAPAVPRPDFSLSGLVWNSDRPQAILNGQVVNLGDQVEQWTVTAISRKGVEMTFQDIKIMVEPNL